MNKEMTNIAAAMQEALTGNPWYGKSIMDLLREINAATAIQKPGGQHSILELVWHMVNWKAFALNRLTGDNTQTSSSYEENDWAVLNHEDQSLWPKAVDALQKVTNDLITTIPLQKDERLEEKVPGRAYTYRNLLYGVLEHDIYHTGQVAYILKLLKKK